jgi:hypothetical protein
MIECYSVLKDSEIMAEIRLTEQPLLGSFEEAREIAKVLGGNIIKLRFTDKRNILNSIYASYSGNMNKGITAKIIETYTIFEHK